MRKEWFQFVKKIRDQETRKNKRLKKPECTHREAMKIASEKWPKEKAKLIRKQQREAKKCKVKSPVKTEECSE